MDNNLNKLLTRQIKRHFGSTDNLPEELKGIMKDINETYNNFDDDTRLIQNSIEISSHELRDAFQKQKQDAETQKEINNKIREAIQAMKPVSLSDTGEIEPILSNSNDLFDTLILLIEERKQTAEALKESEIKYGEVVENIKEIIFQTDAEGFWIFLNKAWEEVTGFSVNESLGQLFFNYVHPDDRQRNMDLFEPLIMRKKDYCRHQIRYLTKDGGFRWIEVFARLGLNEKDEIIGTYGTLQDITESKKAEEALQQSNRKWEAIISASPDGIGMATLDGKLQLLSDRLAVMFGYSSEEKEELHGRNLSEFIDSSNHELLKKNIGKILAGESNQKFTEYIAIKKDKSLFYVEVNSTVLLDIAGKPESILFVERDITERKKVEEALRVSENFQRSLLENVGVGIMIIDPTTRLVESVNSYASLLFGDNAENIIGHSCHQFMCPAEENSYPVCDLDLKVDSSQRLLIRADKSTLDVLKTVKKIQIGGKEKLLESFVDISIQKKAEEAFQQSSKKWEAIISASPDGIGMASLDGKLQLMSDKLAAMYGYTVEQKNEYIGKSFFDFIDPSNQEQLRDNISKALSGDKSRKISEYIGIKKDNSRFYVDVNSTVLVDTAGNPESILFVERDITERKEAEKALQQSETLLRSIMDTTLDVIFVKDRACRFVYINPAGCVLNGKTREQLVGYSKADFMTNKVELAKFMADDMRIIEGGITETFEEDILGADGKLYSFLTTKSPRYDGQGNIIGLIGLAHNITERKLAEKNMEQLSTRLSLATRAGGVGVWDYDHINKIFLWDDQMFSLNGIQKETFDVTYEAWKSILHPDDVKRVDAEIQMAIHSKKEFDTEYRVIWPDSSIHTIKALALVERDEASQPLRMIGTNWDVTEKKLVEEKLLKAVEAADAANKAKSEFLANMSHEIRTPLNGVIGFTDLLKSTQLSKVQEQYVKNANASGHTLLEIINDILDFSKIEAGMLELDINKTDIMELLGNSVDIIKYAAEKKSLEVLLNIDPKMPRFALVDSVRLKQIFANLMGNAVKFTEKGEIELKVGYQDLGSNQGRFSFSVSDTGIGITQEQQKKLFKVFSQADSSTSRRFGGTGLGLVISDMISKKMGSKINIKSQQGVGTTFYFDLIANVEYGERMDTSAIHSVKRGFIIDDNLNNRIILEHTLTNWGIECESCDNGLTALKLIETSKPFDVIICDYHMPYIDGLETIKMIREKLKLSAYKQPVILLHSSSDNEELHRKCDELGVRFRLTKPVKADELYSYLCKLNTLVNNNEIIEEREVETPKTERISTILITEDNDFNMILVKTLVSRMLPTARIIEAINGKEAVMLCQKEQPDIILMDIQMPEMNGLEATAKIREMEKNTKRNTPIIALTAGVIKEEQEKCMSAGMDDYLTKPIDNELLQNMIFKYLKNKIVRNN